MKSNFIIHQKAKQYQWSGDCFLSIKSFYNGTANYDIGHRSYKVSDDSFLILNDCTKYDLTIDTASETESFCVFFSPEFIEQAITECYVTDQQLLDQKPVKFKGLNLLERHYQNAGTIASLLNYGRNHLSDCQLERDEFYHQLLNAIIIEDKHSLLETERLALKKKSTRVEIYQRIYCAKNFIDNNYKSNLTLKAIAMASTLSENHLLRCFKEVVGVSPFKYISNLRIKEAARQIKETDRAINEIAFDLGYSSMSNFSHYFKTIMGTPPSQFKSGDI